LAEKERKRLLIIGKGNERENLISLISKWHLENYIQLLGFKENPYPWIKRSDCLVLSSISEGMPTVLIEAMALKTPVISTDCPSGPKEITDNGESGILVPMNKPKILADALNLIYTNEKLREQLIKKGLKKSKLFTIVNSVISYEREIIELIG
jgi:glycosyltransferase involved in cell wall biosynthesis